MAHSVKNLPAMQKTWVRFLRSGRSPGEGKEMAIHSSILAWKNPMDGGAWRATVHGVTELDTTERLALSLTRIGPQVAAGSKD